MPMWHILGGMPWLPCVHLGWLGLGIKKDAIESQETLEAWILQTLQVLDFWLSKSTWPRNVQHVPQYLIFGSQGPSGKWSWADIQLLTEPPG